MAIDPLELSAHEQTLDEVLARYLKARDAGQEPDRRDLAARYPELADELEQYFAEHDKMEQWAEPLRSVSESARIAPSLTDLDEEVTASPAAGPGPALLRLDTYELIEPIARG